MIKPEDLAGRTEHSQQVALFHQAALHLHKYPQLKMLFAIPNANSHRMVSEGVRGGVPDIMLAYASSTDGRSPIAPAEFYGLFIEMKIEERRKQKNGGCSDDQLRWLANLEYNGYKTAVCYGWQEAWKVIEEYLNG